MGIRAERDDPQLKGLLESLGQDEELQRLEARLKKFNLFEALRLVWHEVRHSDFLAYLLDPQQNHGLGDSFLKSLLRCAVDRGDCGVSPSDIAAWNIGQAEVRREWKNIDVLVRDERNRIAIIIENKIASEEHSDQLARYFSIVSHEFSGWKIIAIFLTLDSTRPSDHRYLTLGYDRVCSIIEDILKQPHASMPNDVRVLIEHYAEMLRRHHLSDSKLAELCRQIYAKHKQALDLIYEHRPARQQSLCETLEEWVRENSALQLDESSITKTYFGFFPKTMDEPALRPNAGAKLILMFWVEAYPTGLTVKLYVGPGPSELRRKLLDFATRNQPLLRSSSGREWSTIFSKTLVEEKAYRLPEDECIGRLKERWNEFITVDMPTIVAAVAKEEWIHRSADSNDTQQGELSD